MTPSRIIQPEPYWVAAVGAVIADQLAKWLVGQLAAPISLPGLFLGAVVNTNGVLGLHLSNAWLTLSGLLICASLLALLMTIATRPPVRLGLWLMLAGAFSNTLDRIFHGGVVDIISIFGLSQFNVADVMILLGALSLLRGIWWREERYG